MAVAPVTIERHRAHVGPPRQWDLLGGIQFALLIAAGLREENTLLDVGCGSLRAGRFLITYLRPDGYCGIEPEEAIVAAGVDHELGQSVVELKRPRFEYRSDFDASSFGERFDFVLAQSIFTHTHPDLARVALERIAEALGSDGVLLANWTPRRRFGPVLAREPIDDAGWLYPETVKYRWREVEALVSGAGLAVRPVAWAHPRLRWFVAARSDDRAREAAARIPRAFKPLRRTERLYVDLLTRLTATTRFGARAWRRLRRPLRRRPLGHPGRHF